MTGKLLAAVAVVASLALPTGVSAQAPEKDPEAEAEVSDLERRMREFEAALDRLRDLADEEAIARAKELARELERKFGDRAEELAREGADDMRRILNELLEAVPQYEWPEVTEDGDIILRRVPPGEERKPRPEEDENFDET